jgi:mono/diheme cytochrome c family protein
MKIVNRILAGLGIIIVLLVAYILLFWKKTFNPPYPNIKASKDSAIIARGKYLAYGPMHCASCHVPMDKMADVDAGKEIPLTGGWEIDIPPGVFRSRNITPDMETGIGKLTDEEIARTLRYNVASDGRMLLGFMPFQQTSDEDLTALVSFLRSQEPVKNDLKHTEYTFLGKALQAFGVVKPEGPATPPPVSVIRDSTKEYGKYIVHNIANCKGCHTIRDLKTGKLTGTELAGGWFFEPDKMSEGYGFVPPNLTPDPETGVMTNWSEEAFVNRFRAGRVYKTSPMPWGSFSRIEEVDLKAIYRYLHSIAPVNHKVERTVYAPGEKAPEIK